ncbi:hypothetical protein [Terrabacter aerolatus]|uniref:hypothetical protein n=1 Tax=Terrabacter aerolatus TaxID=422442 RepID=UPI0011BFA84A|nr:hypothetical protein [Terrabacter aerolatus]
MVTETGLAGPLPTDDVSTRFVEIVCADEDLLAAEFEAIISASWPPSPAPPRPDGAGDSHVEQPVEGPRPAPRPRWLASRTPRRQRSPPRPARRTSLA